MSPLWRDRMQVFLAPGRVDLARLQKGIKPKQATRLAAACEQKPGLPAWEAPLEQFEQMIENAGGADMSITLSNAFVRYVVLTAQPSIATPAELHAYAAFQMREVFGERAATWDISVSSWDPCSGGICAAVERSFLERLGEVSTRGKVRLKYVEPYLTGAFDHWHKRFNETRAWFALLESRTALPRAAGEWRVATHKQPADRAWRGRRVDRGASSGGDTFLRAQGSGRDGLPVRAGTSRIRLAGGLRLAPSPPAN